MKRKVVPILLLLILASLFSFTPRVGADGSVAAQDVNATAILGSIYPINYTDSNDGQSSVEDIIRGSRFALDSDTLGWQLHVYHSNARIRTTGAGPNEFRVGIYQDGGAFDPTSLLGESDRESIGGPGTAWEDFSYTSNASIPLNATHFWAVIWADAIANDWQICYKTIAAGNAWSIWVNQAYNGFPNPLAGENQVNDRIYHIRNWVGGEYDGQTSHNKYTGSPTDYQARRDLNVSFPTSMGGSSSRQITITYPNTEYLESIKYKSGVNWLTIPSANYTDDTTYNLTHGKITIPEATIATTGGDLRVYTHTYPYQFTFYGLYWENGSVAGAVNVTAHKVDTSETYLVSVSRTLSFNESVVMFSFQYSTCVRRLYVVSDIETFYLFAPDGTYASYEFTVQDFTGKLRSGTAYLETYRTINGTDSLIERMKIQDTLNTVPVTCVVGQVYHIKILWSDGTYFDWGYWIAGYDPEPTIVVRGVNFSDQAQITYRHVTVEATRPTDTQITVNYLDSLGQTNWVNISISERDGAVVHTDSSTSSSKVFNWAGADADTDYVVNVLIDHQFYGTDLSASFFLDATKTFASIPNVSAFGTWGGMSTGNLITFCLGVVFFGGFSYQFGSKGGMLVALAVVSVLTGLGYADYSYDFLAFCWFVAIVAIWVSER